MADPQPATILQGGRAKAYRPIPETERRQAAAAALDAYDRGDFFLAHELLEPAWMGTDRTGDRELYQGLIKVAAAFVHGVRGNPRGVGKNLVGARTHLAAAIEAGGAEAGVDVADLVAAIDERLALLSRDPDSPLIEPPSVRRIAG